MEGEKVRPGIGARPRYMREQRGVHGLEEPAVAWSAHVEPEIVNLNDENGITLEEAPITSMHHVGRPIVLTALNTEKKNK